MNSIQANYEYNLIYNELTSIYHEMTKRYKLSECQFWILYAINEENRPLTQAEISRYLIAPKQTIHSSIQTLLKEGYIELSEVNGKKKYFSLTKLGISISNSTVKATMDVEIKAFDAFTEKERTEFIRLNQKLIQQLHNHSKEAQ